MSPWLTTLVAVCSVLFGGGGIVAMIQAFTGRKARKAEVADRLSDSSLKWVQEFQEEAAAAREETRQSRLEVAEARREAMEARRELADVRREAEALVRELRELRSAVLSPTATLDHLRDMVGGTGMNGRL